MFKGSKLGNKSFASHHKGEFRLLNQLLELTIIETLKHGGELYTEVT